MSEAQSCNSRRESLLSTKKGWGLDLQSFLSKVNLECGTLFGDITQWAVTLEIRQNNDFQKYSTTGRNCAHYTTSVDEKLIVVMNLKAQSMICSADLYQTYHSMSDAFSFSLRSVLEKNRV